MNDINEPNKKKIKKENIEEKNKINDIAMMIRANNLCANANTSNISNISNNYFTYGEFIRIQEEKFRLQKNIGPPALQVPISPWLSYTLDNDDIPKRPKIDL